VPDEAGRALYYREKVDAFDQAQQRGLIAQNPDADLLVFMVLALAAWWSAVPQVARMLSGPIADPQTERARRRSAVIEAARRIADPGSSSPTHGSNKLTTRPLATNSPILTEEP